ncbi:MAG: alginate export family protein [Flavobacteriaceae bacterium]|nr:alginate export family protein [Flavobacteriaceae bacterium]
MKKIFYLTAFLTLFITTISAQQFGLSAEIRPRFENRHGYKKLINQHTDGANFISQRSRLNFNFKQDKINLYVSLQNIRVWGDVSTLSSSDNANSFHQAWAEAILSDKVSLKFGRQEIIYDDHRIFGNVGWAQQARSHDAFLFKYTPNKNNRLDLGFAVNSDSQGLTDVLYSNAAGYKAFQYAWYHGKFDKIGLSLLFLNTGIEYLDSNDNQAIDYMQTIGTRFTYKSGKFKANAATYFQSGKSRNAAVSAGYFGANLGYKVSSNFVFGLGLDYLSGKSMNDTSSDIKSFAPLFGTNHKFNGWMDYFYVGNHGNSVGLTDINMTLAYKKDKFSAKMIPHFFSAAADVYDGTTKMDNKLGTEIDMVLGYKIAKEISFNMGFSKMYATRSMEILKGGSKDAANSWGWIMFTFKPKLFSVSGK